MKKYRLLQVVLFAVCVSGLALAGGQPARAADSDEPITFEESFGASVGMALYNVQIVVGMAADAYPKNVYTNEESLAILNEQKSMMSVVGTYVDGLLALSTLSDSDRDSLVNITGCISKLNLTTDALIAYVNNPTQDNANDFDAKRQVSYSAIAALLNIDENSSK